MVLIVERHPLCTCPEMTWDAMTGRALAPDRDACRKRAPLSLDPHPVIDLAVILTSEMTGRAIDTLMGR